MRCSCCDAQDAHYVDFYEEYLCDVCLRQIQRTYDDDEDDVLDEVWDDLQ